MEFIRAAQARAAASAWLKPAMNRSLLSVSSLNTLICDMERGYSGYGMRDFAAIEGNMLRVGDQWHPISSFVSVGIGDAPEDWEDAAGIGAVILLILGGFGLLLFVVHWWGIVLTLTCAPLGAVILYRRRGDERPHVIIQTASGRDIYIAFDRVDEAERFCADVRCAMGSPIILDARSVHFHRHQ